MKNISNPLHQVKQSWINPSLWSIMNLKTFSDQQWLAHCQRSEMATNNASVLLLSLNTCSSAPVQPEIMRTLTPLWLFSCAFPALLLGGPCQQTFALIGPWYLTAFCFIHEEWDSSSNKCMIRNRGFTGSQYWTETPMQYRPDNNRQVTYTHRGVDKLLI